MRIQKVIYEYEDKEELNNHIIKIELEGFKMMWYGYKENLLRQMVLMAEYINMKLGEKHD